MRAEPRVARRNCSTRPSRAGTALGATVLMFCGLLCLASPLAAAAPTGSPAQAVQTTIETTRDAILAQAESLASDADAAEALIRDNIVPRLDTRATARFVLGRRWQQANKPQQQRFHHAFTRHVTATYALLLHRFADEVVAAMERVSLRTETVRAGDRTALVRTFFRLGNGPERQARVHLHARHGEWFLFDAEYAGFSLLRVWRDEIQGRLGNQPLVELINDLQERHSRLPPVPETP